MKCESPNRWKVWADVALFFSVGITIGLATALYYLQRRRSFAFAIFAGSFSGGYGAWFVFFIVYKVIDFIERIIFFFRNFRKPPKP